MLRGCIFFALGVSTVDSSIKDDDDECLASSDTSHFTSVLRGRVTFVLGASIAGSRITAEGDKCRRSSDASGLASALSAVHRICEPTALEKVGR